MRKKNPPLPQAFDVMVGALLLGLVLLSAVLYYRSVRVQRFWEPALAMSNPRVEFAEGIRARFQDAFGSGDIPGVFFSGQSVFVDAGLVAASEVHGGGRGPQTITNLAAALESLLAEPELRNYIDVILIITFFPPTSPENPSMVGQRRLYQHRSEALLDKLFSKEPDLSQAYGHFFVPTAFPAETSPSLIRFIEIRFVPAGRQHIRVLQELEHYFR